MIKSLLMLSLFFLCLSAWATIFSRMPIEKQVEEANSAVVTRLASARAYKNSSGMIMTEYRFEVLESFNLHESDIEGQELKLTMPGGTVEGVTSMIDGAPKFAIGEHSFLLLKKIESRIYLSNFTLGKYRIQNKGGEIYYTSEVFPTDPMLGTISKNKMMDLMRRTWKISSLIHLPYQNKLREVASDVYRGDKKNNKFERREPAQEVTPEEGVPFFFWSALFLVLFFFTLIFVKLAKSEHQHKCE
ncbi:MAG: hypothetical protein KBD76_08870 [Bacteriovorax sp.]|nr:hypothetical protein [Bacteriovorax sp.]